MNNTTKKMRPQYQAIMKMKSIDRMFDLLISGAYLDGKCGEPVPINDAREVFQRMKFLMKQEYRKKKGD